MIYRVVTNTLTGCLEAESLAGTQSATIGCVWSSTETYNCQVDCDGCSLGGVTASATYLGYNASALNNGVSVGKSSSTTCTSIAIGCGATSYDNGIAIGTNLTACCDEVLIGDKVIITDNTVINGSDGGCSNVVAINATATASCQVVINGLVDVNTDGVSLGYGDIYAKVCCDCIDVKGCTAVINVGTNSVTIGANATTAAACAVAIGYCACASNGSVALGYNATATCGIDIKGANSEVRLDNTGSVIVGISNTVCTTGNTVVGSSQCTGSGTTDTVVIGQSNTIPDACTISEAVVIGDLGEIGVDYAGSISSGDVILGGYTEGPFKYCASNGYTYSNEKLMTGRILDSCSELPATDCSLLLYYVS